MTAHNGGGFLREAVRSVLAQTRPDWELIVVDNASTDGSVDALVTDVRDERVRVFRPDRNLHIAEGTNFAQEHSRGHYVAVVDHDDVLMPARFARQIAWLEAHPELGAVASRTELIDEGGRPIGVDFSVAGPDEHRTFTQFSQAANFGSHLFRRELLERFPRRAAFPFSSDFDFVARINEVAAVATMPEILFRYRVHARQATQTHRLAQLVAECAIRRLTAQRRRNRPEEFEREIAWRNEVLGRSLSGADVFRAAVVACRDEDEPLLAVYHARRLLGVSRAPRDLMFAIANVARTVRAAPDRLRLARLFFRGPLRTFQLRRD